jgi:hypothetical protein
MSGLRAPLAAAKRKTQSGLGLVAALPKVEGGRPGFQESSGDSPGRLGCATFEVMKLKERKAARDLGHATDRLANISVNRSAVKCPVVPPL